MTSEQIFVVFNIVTIQMNATRNHLDMDTPKL